MHEQDMPLPQQAPDLHGNTTADRAASPDGSTVARWWVAGSLGASGALLLVLAGAAAWLSFQAQAGYVAAHNGGAVAQARTWAVLLDAATAGVSLLRLHDALTGCGAVFATRVVLAGCIGASVAMNLLHSPSRTAGGFLVAGVPPLLYAVLLELLLVKVSHLLMPARRGATAARLRRAAVWAHFPTVMWSAHRNRLRRAVTDYPAEAQPTATGAARPGRQADSPPTRVNAADTGRGADQTNGKQRGHDAASSGRGADAAVMSLLPLDLGPQPAARRDWVRRADGQDRDTARRGRVGVKRAAFEARLMAQIRAGDHRVLSTNRRVRNGAAYEAAASLPAPLSPGTARRYVLDALPRLRTAQQTITA